MANNHKITDYVSKEKKRYSVSKSPPKVSKLNHIIQEEESKSQNNCTQEIQDALDELEESDDSPDLAEYSFMTIIKEESSRIIKS